MASGSDFFSLPIRNYGSGEGGWGGEWEGGGIGGGGGGWEGGGIGGGGGGREGGGREGGRREGGGREGGGEGDGREEEDTCSIEYEGKMSRMSQSVPYLTDRPRFLV